MIASANVKARASLIKAVGNLTASATGANA